MKTSLLTTTLLACAAAAQAHITLEEPQAQAGAPYKAVLRVTHGCEGSPTHSVSVRLPAGFRGARPMPKPGWAVTTERAPLAEPYQNHGRTVHDDVVAITWKALSREAWLADEHFDEFVLRGQAPAAPGPAWFKVLQQCEKGQSDWAETPAGGTSTRGLKRPAVLLDVRPARGARPAQH